MSRPTLRSLPLFITAGVACLAAGCVDESRDGDATVVTFALWVPGLVFLGGLLAVPLGLLVRQKSPGWGWLLVIAGPIAALVFAPGLYMDHVKVTPQGFTKRTGFWFAPTLDDVRFADLSEIALTAEEKTGRRGRKSTSYYLECAKKSGGVVKVAVGDLMKERGLEVVLIQAKKQGVPIVDRTGGL